MIFNYTLAYEQLVTNCIKSHSIMQVLIHFMLIMMKVIYGLV